jgi:hypothetical protein
MNQDMEAELLLAHTLLTTYALHLVVGRVSRERRRSRARK